jgi:hypothetical protein
MFRQVFDKLWRILYFGHLACILYLHISIFHILNSTLLHKGKAQHVTAISYLAPDSISC